MSQNTNNKKILIRVQKIIADSGLCSRRNAEELIKAGRVKVNQEYAEIGQSANPETDIITVDDVALDKPQKRYIILYKPFGVHTTTKDTFAKKMVTDILKDYGVKERVYPVGRLDKNASGLLLLTNDGDWANSVIHPSVGYEKEYQAKTNRALTKKEMLQVNHGILLKDGPVQARVKSIARDQYTITLKAGRHKIVKRIFKFFNIHVTDLKRIRIGPYKLGKMKPGECREIKPAQRIKPSLKFVKNKTNSKSKAPFKKSKRPKLLRKEDVKKPKKRQRTKKTSPKIDQEFTKRQREKKRNPQKKQSTRTEKEKPNFEFKKSKNFKNDKLKSDRSKVTKRNEFNSSKKRADKHETVENPKKRNNFLKKEKVKPSKDTDKPRRLESVSPKNKFNKEIMLKKIGKKRSDSKAKRAAKKRWD